MQYIGHLVSRTNKDLQHFNVLVPRERKLESTFALDQLTGLANHLDKNDFIHWIGYIFGFDIDPETCEKLRQALINGSVPNPEIEIVPRSKLENHDGAYDQKRKIILVSEEVVDTALEEDGEIAIDASWELMIALVEEFGHHVDNLLRTVYSAIGGDAPEDEGANYAYSILHLDYAQTKSTYYADYIELGVKTKVFVDYTDFNEYIQKYLSEEDRLDDGKSGDLEFFGSGRNNGIRNNSYGHQSIEDSLAGAGFAAPEREKVYIGNWESDNSQVMVPILVSGPNKELGFKRDTLVKVIDLLCQLHFGENRFHVTRQSLGVYLPEHHIDNPLGIENGKEVDPEFPPKWTAAEIGIDPVRSMKNFIATSGRGWNTATGEIEKRINSAIYHGRTDKGLREFGRALHVIEDYYAHSNFIELTLRKLGYKDVSIWVPTPAKGRAIVTTGCFGGLDAAATIMGTLGEILQKDEPFVAGKRTASQRLILILLEEKYPKIARYYAQFLEFTEKVERKFPWIFKLMYNTVGKVIGWFKSILGSMLSKIWDLIGTAQSAFDKDPNSTDPTHTQIAKDHDDHCFHVIAAQLASVAVLRTSQVMVQRWNGASSQKIPIGIIRFPSTKYSVSDISSAERSNLDLAVKQIQSRATKGATVNLVGHASADGIDERNQFLSEQRAIAVEDYLRSKVNDPNIKYTHSGKSMSGAAAHDPEWRRTDIELSFEAPNPVAVANSFLVHPEDTNWMDEIVKKWALGNGKKIKEGAQAERFRFRLSKFESKSNKFIKEGGHSSESVAKWVDEAEEKYENFIFS